MPIKYIGKTTDFKGKSLWEIIGNLKNFGIGRIVTRNMYKRYPEKSYMKIVYVETLPNPEYNTPDEIRKVRVLVENVFRGHKYEELLKIEATSYKADYTLIPKDEEAEFCKIDTSLIKQKIYPRTTSFPPLLRELIVREMKANGEEVTEEPQMTIAYSLGTQFNYRVAEEGETPNTEFVSGFGKPSSLSMSLYKGLKL